MSLKNTPRVSIIVLNWNGWKDTIECLESLYRITYPNYDVIVVDNGSRDDSIQRIKEYAKGKIRIDSKFFQYNPSNKPIRVFEVSEDEAKRGKFSRSLYEKFDPDRRMILIKNRDNHGFAGGNNVGIKFALSALNPDYVLILNNDTVVDKNFLNELVKVAESDEKIGIVGPKIYYYDYNGRSDVINWAGEKVNLFTGIGKVYLKDQADSCSSNIVLTSDIIIGACMLISGEVLNKIGLFYEPYFLYFEESDFCVRAKRCGYNLIVNMMSKVWHKVGAIRKRKISYVYVYHYMRNRFRFLKRFLSSPYLFLSLLYLLFIRIEIDFLYFLWVSHFDRRIIKSFIDGLLDGMRILIYEKRLKFI